MLSLRVGKTSQLLGTSDGADLEVGAGTAFATLVLTPNVSLRLHDMSK